MRKTVLIVLLLLFVLGASARAASKYEVEVDITNQIVTVYRGEDRSDEAIVRQMLCSSGKNNSTPKGTFFVFTRPNTDRKEWYWIKYYQAYVQYATRFFDDYMFHSLPYSSKDLASIDQNALSRMGTAASHGCIRLFSDDAQWLAENCEDGTKVHIYISKQPDEELRALLMRGGFSADERTYAEFLGYAEGEGVVSRASEADEVMPLQALFRDWGLYGGEVDGEYSFEFMSFVYELQKELNLPATGIADKALTDAIASGALTPGVQAHLAPGSTGAAVAEMQKALSTLGYYEGEIDGVYGEELTESARLYRTVQRMDDAYDADTAFQVLLRAEAEDIAAMGEVKLVLREVEHNMARVQDGKVLALRRIASREANLLRYVKPEDEVFMLGPVEGHWAHVNVDGVEGYILSEFLDFYTQTFLEAYYE